MAGGVRKAAGLGIAMIYMLQAGRYYLLAVVLVLLAALLRYKGFLFSLLLGFLDNEMRSPTAGSIWGSIAVLLMRRSNELTAADALRKLMIYLPASTHLGVFVELGPGEGFALKELKRLEATRRFQRVIGVEISAAFRASLDKAAEEMPDNFELFESDARRLVFLPDDSTDGILACNVVYFLDPLAEYLKEMHRVLRPGGVVLFACKFRHVKRAGGSFVNVDENVIMQSLEEAGFTVSRHQVEEPLPHPAWYTAIVAIKK